MHKLCTSLAAAAVALLAFAAPAAADLQFSALINGAPFSCVDQAACDTNSTPGILQTGTQTVGGVQFLGSSQTQTTGANNTLNTTSFQINNTTSGTVAIQFAVGGTGFIGPVATLSESGSGTFENAIGSTIDLSYYADAANNQGADTPTDFPGVLQADSGLITAALLTDSFNFNQTSAFSDNDLFSMTLGTSGTLVAGGQLTGRSQAIVGQQVPEPGSLLLFSTVLVGLGWLARRRKRSGPAAA